MPKMAATLFGSNKDVALPSLLAVDPATPCILCGERVNDTAYATPEWGSVSNWNAYAGAATARTMVLCATCVEFVALFQKHEEQNKMVARERLGSGWHRKVAGESTMEHYSLGQLKKNGPGDIWHTPYWITLHQAVFESRAHSWVLIDGNHQGNLYPYLPYTPAHSPYLTILTFRAGFYTVRLRRTLLWDTLYRVATRQQTIHAIDDGNLRHIVKILVPAEPFPEWPVPPRLLNPTKSEEVS